MIWPRRFRQLFAPPRPPEVRTAATDTLDLIFDQTRRVYDEQQTWIERITTRLTFVMTVATALFAAGISQLPGSLARLEPLAGRLWQMEALGRDVAVPLIWYHDEIWLAGLLLTYASTVVMAFAADAPETIAETPEPEILNTFQSLGSSEVKRSIIDTWTAAHAFNRLRLKAKQRRLRWAVFLLVAEALYLGLAVVAAFSA